MTVQEPAAHAEPAGIRPAVRAVPAYPFTSIDVPIKLDQNESPYDFPEELKQEVYRRLAERDFNRYPDLHADALKHLIGRYEDWPHTGVVLTPGSNVLIKILTELAGIEQTVLTTNPTFSVYSLEAQLLDATLVQVPLNPDFSLPVAALKTELARHKPGVLAIAQPHAPTGHIDTDADLLELLEAARDWVVVIDEAYHQFSGTDRRDLVRRYPNALSLRIFSKAWGLAGIRAGYAMAGPEVAENLQKLVSAFNVNVMTETVLEVALEHPEYMKARIEQCLRERAHIQAALADHPNCQVLPSQANFFLMRTPNADLAYAHLLAHGIVTRRQDNLHMLQGCLRVAVGTPQENDRFIAAMKAFH